MARASHRTRWMVLGAAVLVVAVIALLVPRIAIVIYPRVTDLSDQIEITVDIGTAGSAPRAGAVRGREGVVVIEAQEQVPVQGRQADPSAYATGIVTFVNRSGASATIPIGTEVMTASGARYVTTAQASIAGAVDAIVRAPIRARFPGDAGNAGRLEVNRVLGPLSTTITALNEAPITGGGVGTNPRVLDEDRARAREIAIDRLRTEGIRALRAEANPDDVLVEQTIGTVLLRDECDAQTGATASALTCRVQGRVSAGFYARSEVGAAARAAWRPVAPAGFFIPRGQIAVGEPRVVGSPAGTMRLSVPMATPAVAEFDVNAVRDNARGRLPETTRRDLRARLNLPADPIVRLEPSWIPWAWRVDVALDLNAPPR